LAIEDFIEEHYQSDKTLKGVYFIEEISEDETYGFIELEKPFEMSFCINAKSYKEFIKRVFEISLLFGIILEKK